MFQILLVSVCCSALFAAQLIGQPPDSSINSDSFDNGTEIYKNIISKIFQSVRDEDTSTLKSLLSRQYIQSGDRLKSLLESQGRSTEHFDQGILRDFNFYTPLLPIGFKSEQDAALLTVKVQYNPSFLEKHKTGAQGIPISKSLWNDMGGYIFAETWVDDSGGALATFYLVKQNNTWRLHNVYFSNSELNDEAKSSVLALMKTLAGPN